MPHVGVKRLGARQREDDRAHREKARERLFDEEAGGVHRVDHRQDDLRPVDDVDQAKHREAAK